MIDNALKTMVYSRLQTPGAKDDGEVERWKARVQAYKQWKEKHALRGSLKAGDKVDVRDTEYIWCTGVIELKISTLNRLPLLYVHYEV